MPPPPSDLFLPMASIKMMLGARFLASANRLRTLLAPRPLIISINSDPFMDKKGTLDSLAPEWMMTSSTSPRDNRFW